MAKTCKTTGQSPFSGIPHLGIITQVYAKSSDRAIFCAIFSHALQNPPLRGKFRQIRGFFRRKEKGGTAHPVRMACPAPPLSARSVQGKACALGLVLAAGCAAAHGDHTGCAGVVFLVDTVTRRTADLQRRVRHGAGAAVGKGAVLLLEGGAIRLVAAAGRAALYLDAGTAAAAIPEIRAVLHITL